jgi:hypothetical protein
MDARIRAAVRRAQRDCVLAVVDGLAMNWHLPSVEEQRFVIADTAIGYGHAGVERER